MKIAIDPGTYKTGIAVFSVNDLITTQLIKSSSKNTEWRQDVLLHQIKDLLRNHEPIESVAIEKFEQGYMKAKSIRTLDGFAGRIAGLVFGLYDFHPEWISKSQTTKAEARWFARSIGFERWNDKQAGDEIDAIWVGHLAGYIMI